MNVVSQSPPPLRQGTMSPLTLNQASTLSTTSLGDDTAPRKGSAFWLSFLAILVSMFLSALDLSAIPTALPTITDDLNGGDKFIWIGSAYGLASAAVLLLAGRLADIFGRKPVMLSSIALFTLGSVLGGISQSMDMLIAARGKYFESLYHCFTDMDNP